MSRRRAFGSRAPEWSRYFACSALSAVAGERLRTLMARWMSCLRPGPASESTFTMPGVPPTRCAPMPAPARPFTTSWRVSASYQMDVFKASYSSGASHSLARSQIHGGSATWASQSKVGKLLVIGANFWTGMRGSLVVELHSSPVQGSASTLTGSCSSWPPTASELRARARLAALAGELASSAAASRQLMRVYPCGFRRS